MNMTQMFVQIETSCSNLYYHLRYLKHMLILTYVSAGGDIEVALQPVAETRDIREKGRD